MIQFSARKSSHPHNIAEPSFSPYLRKMQHKSTTFALVLLVFATHVRFSASAQVDCGGWNPDVEGDYQIGVTDILGILGIFGQADSDMDGVWDGSDQCLDTAACNYDNNPTAPCAYEDVFGVCGGDGALPELLVGTWKFSTAAGAVAVGPSPYSTEWFSSPVGGLQAAQYDDRYIFGADGSFTTDYNGSIIDAFADYSEQAYGCSSAGLDFLAGGGTSGEDALVLSATECACPFIGVTDAGLAYDIVSLTPTTLVLHAQGDNANCAPGNFYFTLTFTRVVEDETGDANGYPAAASYPGMAMVWSDEFDGTAVNTNNWTYDLGASGWGNNEWQNYTNSAANSSVADGLLTITAKQEPGGGFTSARMKTQGLQSFQFGRIDVRAKLPQGQGIWPAIWMLGENFGAVSWPACGEIDIMELVGHQPSTVHGTAHWGSSWNQHQYDGSSISLPGGETFSDAFHLFSVVWEENSIMWLMDDVPFYSLTPADMNGQPYPFNAPFFFILNIAVGGNWPGYPDASTSFPQQMVVDCIRVFQNE